MYIRAITKGKEIVAKRIRKGIKGIEILQNKNSSIFFMSHQSLSKETIMEKIVYTVNDIQELLGCGRNKAYSLIKNAYENQDSFHVIRVGKNYLVPKESFHKWLVEAK